jgi:phosphoglycerol transferase MdoB-like AlkP superfamily enzyme
VLLAALLWLALSSATRIALALRPDVASVGGLGDWIRVFGYGVLFDLVAALYILTPAVLWLALVPQPLARTAVHRALSWLAFSAAVCGFLVLAVSEWLFWDEFGGRFNFIAVDYLLYTHEVVANVWQSYPIGKVLLALAALAVLVGVLLRRSLWHTAAAPLAWRSSLAFLLAWGLAVGATLRWVDTDLKNFSASDAANDLAGNGLYEFFAANHRNELSYERHYAVLPPGEDLALVRTALGVTAREGVERHVAPPRPERRLNVVLVSVESLGAEFLGTYDNPHGLTPNLDRLARESLWFSAVYATGNRTVRGLEALSLSLPPTPGQSIVRRPGNENLFSLGSVFEDKGYAVLFAYGGYGYFDNMNAFFEAND